MGKMGKMEKMGKTRTKTNVAMILWMQMFRGVYQSE